MDITDTTQLRFNLGIERFLAGESLAYEDVVFYKNKEQSLQISSYSDWEPERTTVAHAKEKIERAKKVIEYLKNINESFRIIAEQLPHEHYFCYNYGKGNIALAKETDAKFHWVNSHHNG